MINEPCPEIRNLLFEASSQATTSFGRTLHSLCEYSSTCRVLSELTVTSPLGLTSWAPKAWNSAPAKSTQSVELLRPMPNGWPFAAHFSATSANLSQVHSSCSFLSDWPPGPAYILVTSSPANCLNMLMRAQGGFTWLPVTAGAATQWPFGLPR